ncbi:MAG: 30S ribosomal protein S3 [bacterium]
MGQKVNPMGFRLIERKNWGSRWFAQGKEYKEFLKEDIKIREFIKKKMLYAGISKIEIERFKDKVKVNIFAARPGIIIGKKGFEIENLIKDLLNITNKQVDVDIIEVKVPELNACLVAENIALQIQKRISYRRAMKKAVQTAIQMGAQGAKIQCSGRLAGSEIARREWYKEGKIPLHTIRENIDYAISTSHTTYGCVGIKVWLCLEEDSKDKEEIISGNTKKSKI